MAKLNVQLPLIQSSVSYDPSEMILTNSFGAQVTFIIVINAENCQHICGNHNTFFQDILMNRKFKRTAFV